MLNCTNSFFRASGACCLLAGRIGRRSCTDYSVEVGPSVEFRIFGAGIGYIGVNSEETVPLSLHCRVMFAKADYDYFRMVII